jgi:hypothetical protein
MRRTGGEHEKWGGRTGRDGRKVQDGMGGLESTGGDGGGRRYRMGWEGRRVSYGMGGGSEEVEVLVEGRKADSFPI